MLGETGPGGTLAEVYAVRGLRGRASLPSDGPSFNEDNPEPFRSRILRNQLYDSVSQRYCPLLSVVRSRKYQ